MLEKNITKAIMVELSRLGFWVTKIHGSAYQQAGLPDILAIKDGKASWFEVKTPGNKPTKIQEQQIKKLREAGCIAEVVTNVDDVWATLVKEKILSAGGILRRGGLINGSVTMEFKEINFNNLKNAMGTCLHEGDYLVPKKALKKYGTKLLDALNKGCGS